MRDPVYLDLHAYENRCERRDDYDALANKADSERDRYTTMSQENIISVLFPKLTEQDKANAVERARLLTLANSALDHMYGRKAV